MTSPKPPGCPYCGQQDLDYLGRLPDSYWFAGRSLPQPLIGGALYACNGCKLKFRFPIHPQSIYRDLYDNSIANTWSTDTPRQDWDLIVRHIKANLPAGARILDFGCYTGGLLARLEGIYECHGLEINAFAAAVARQRKKSQIWAMIEEIPSDLQFDVVIACDVVEHMPDPGCFINMLSRRLKERGHLILTTGDAQNFLWDKFGANWWYCFYPEHISFISKAWIERFSERSGLAMTACHSFRYRRLASSRHIVDFLLTFVYGILPNFYLKVMAALQRTKGTIYPESIPGNGVSADHLFIVLTKS